MIRKLKVGSIYSVQAKSFGVMNDDSIPELMLDEHVMVLDFPDNSSTKILRIQTGEEIIYPTIQGLQHVLQPV